MNEKVKLNESQAKNVTSILFTLSSYFSEELTLMFRDMHQIRHSKIRSPRRFL